jgi:hypothetical protein
MTVFPRAKPAVRPVNPGVILVWLIAPRWRCEGSHRIDQDDYVEALWAAAEPVSL